MKAYWNPQVQPVESQKKDLSTLMGDVDGAAVAIQINSSQEFSTINDAGVKAAKLLLEYSPKQNILPPGTAAPSELVGYSDKVAVIHRIKIAGEVLSDIRIRVSVTPTTPSIPGDPVGNSRAYDSTAPKIVLGVDYLLAHHVLISPIQHLIFISATGATPFGAFNKDAGSDPPIP